MAVPIVEQCETSAAGNHGNAPDDAMRLSLMDDMNMNISSSGSGGCDGQSGVVGDNEVVSDNASASALATVKFSPRLKTVLVIVEDQEGQVEDKVERQVEGQLEVEPFTPRSTSSSSKKEKKAVSFASPLESIQMIDSYKKIEVMTFNLVSEAFEM
jgi:hypothetical protein